MGTENPFRYGIVVDDPYFIDREKEMAEIRLDLVSGNNLIITSPRRYGKTSMAMKLKNGSVQLCNFMTGSAMYSWAVKRT